MNFLESDTFKKGLELVNSLNPAIGPLSSIAVNLIKAFAKRNRKVAVQNFYLGLDFDENGPGARFSEELYVAIQVPPEDLQTWDWNDYQYIKDTKLIVKKNQNDTIIP